jgi:two-component system cell cycle response regulator
MTESTASKPIILVVDDSRLMRVAARKILKEDFDILEAGDGEQAWESLQANPHINLVMSDLSMPNLDGLGLLKRIREDGQEQIRTLPVIIVTGAEDDDGSRQTALAAGASDFITKPFESIQLLARARAQARQQSTQKALASSEASKEQLEQHNPVDLLTGVANARGFANALEENLSFARRHRTELALLLLRVDKYKVMFLRHGKQVAEDVLQRLGRLLAEGRRREDVVARTELDTFGLLLPSANAIGARRIAEQILSAVHSGDFTSGIEMPVSVSIATVSPPVTPDSTAADLMALARERLQEATAAGGNCIRHDVMETAETPTSVPQTAAPLPVTAATPADLQQALEALAAGRQPETDINALVRALLPLLHSWNQAHDGCCDALINELETVLNADTPTGTAVPADAFQGV